MRGEAWSGISEGKRHEAESVRGEAWSGPRIKMTSQVSGDRNDDLITATHIIVTYTMKAIKLSFHLRL